MEDFHKLEFRAMLVRFGEKVTDDEFNNCKMMCKDFIGQRQRSQLKSPIDLFEALEELGKLRRDNLTFLTYLLEKGCNGRADLLSVVTEYQAEHSHSSRISADQLSVARFLSRTLGQNHRMVLRQLGLDDASLDNLKGDNPSNTEEVIYKGLCKCFAHPINASIDTVVTSLERSSRTDLADQIRKGDYKRS